MQSRIVEGIIASLVAALALAMLGQLFGIVELQLNIFVVSLGVAIIISLGISLYSRLRLRKLQDRINKIPYSEYFPDESHSYKELAKMLEDVTRIGIVGLANTNVFHLFNEYKSFLAKSKYIEVLCIDPEARLILRSLDRLVSIAAEKHVLPQLREKLENIPISSELKDEARSLIANSSTFSATSVMIQVSLLLWRALAKEAENQSVHSSNFLHIRLYQCPPTIKGWILGDKRVLRGDFSIPGYGLTEPLMLFDENHAPSELNNFIQTYQLVWTDKNTRDYLVGGKVVSKQSPLTQTDLFTAFAGSFYEKSGISCVSEAIRKLPRLNKPMIVDLGSGTGFCSLKLSRKIGSTGQVRAVDKDESLIHSFEDYLEAISWPVEGAAPIETMRGDINNIDFKPSSVDFVFCRHVIHHIDDPSSALNKIWSWLKPSGILILIEINAPRKEEQKIFINEVAKLSNIENVKYYTLEELKGLLQPFGFKIEKPFFGQDYETPIADYYRRCSHPEDYERVSSFAKLLKLADSNNRRYFNIRGHNSADLILTLPEVLLFCKKVKQKRN